MIVYRSLCRPMAPPPRPDPFAGRLRQALGLAKVRRTPVTLAPVRAIAPPPRGAGGEHANDPTHDGDAR